MRVHRFQGSDSMPYAVILFAPSILDWSSQTVLPLKITKRTRSETQGFEFSSLFVEIEDVFHTHCHRQFAPQRSGRL